MNVLERIRVHSLFLGEAIDLGPRLEAEDLRDACEACKRLEHLARDTAARLWAEIERRGA